MSQHLESHASEPAPWEPEDGRCGRCGAPLDTAFEQDAGLCSFCDHAADDAADSYADCDLCGEFGDQCHCDLLRPPKQPLIF